MKESSGTKESFPRGNLVLSISSHSLVLLLYQEHEIVFIDVNPSRLGADGLLLGELDGLLLGELVGVDDGALLGKVDGFALGKDDGSALGGADGLLLGEVAGFSLGEAVFLRSRPICCLISSNDNIWALLVFIS